MEIWKHLYFSLHCKLLGCLQILYFTAQLFQNLPTRASSRKLKNKNRLWAMQVYSRYPSSGISLACSQTGQEVWPLAQMSRMYAQTNLRPLTVHRRQWDSRTRWLASQMVYGCQLLPPTWLVCRWSTATQQVCRARQTTRRKCSPITRRAARWTSARSLVTSTWTTQTTTRAWQTAPGFRTVKVRTNPPNRILHISCSIASLVMRKAGHSVFVLFEGRIADRCISTRHPYFSDIKLPLTDTEQHVVIKL